MCSEVLLPFNRTNKQVVEKPTLCISILSPEGGWLQRVGGRTSTLTAGSKLGDATIVVTSHPPVHTPAVRYDCIHCADYMN